jgi:hypothetical protein
MSKHKSFDGSMQCINGGKLINLSIDYCKKTEASKQT